MKHVARFALIVSTALVLTAHADERATNLPIGDPARKDREAAVVLDGITDTARGDTLGPVELAARLDSVRLVFVGESHTDMEFHRVQLRVLQELARRGRTVMVGLEMYPVPEQKWLDRWYSDKKMTEEKFLDESHWYKNWGYHWNYYRDIFLFARAQRIRMFAVNLPRRAVSEVRAKGFDSLAVEYRPMLPPHVDLESAEHQRLFRAFFGDTDALHSNLPDAMFQGMYRAQCAWDAAMGWNAVQALRKYGDDKAIMVVLIGVGHVAYGLGAERQTKAWFDGGTASVIPMEIADEPGGKVLEKVQASYANFVWGLPPATDPIYPSTGLSTPESKSGAHYKVINVAEKSPAEAADFKLGDELVSIDGLEIADKETSARLMSTKRWGDDVRYKILRAGQEMDLVVHLRRRAPQAAAAADSAAAPAPKDAPPPAPEKPAGGER